MRGDANLAGSKTVARYQRVNIGTRETPGAPARVGANKPPINGKEAQMASWESDQLVVVLKQSNACGAKGLAGEPRSRDTSSGHGTGVKKTTKLASMAHSTEGEEVVLKSRVLEICKSGSVRGLVVDSQKGLATRPTRPVTYSTMTARASGHTRRHCRFRIEDCRLTIDTEYRAR